MRLMRLGALTVGLTVVLGGQLSAQESRRQGFWIGFGLGGGVNTSEGLDDDRRAGGSVFVRLGGTVSPHVLLGGEAIGWGRSEDGATLTRGNTTFTAMFYPSPSGGFFLKGGIGGSFVSVSTQVLGTTVTATENGFGATAGLGYDARLSDNWSITPGIDFLWQAFDAGQNLSSTNSLLVFTIGFVRH